MSGLGGSPADDSSTSQSAAERAAARLSSLVELDVLAARAAAEVHRLLGDHLVCVTLVDDGLTEASGVPWLVVEAASGNRAAGVTGLRIPPGRGVGGLAASSRRIVSVHEYREETATTGFRRLIAQREGIRGAAGVPMLAEGRLAGILFAGRRQPGGLADQELDVLLEFSQHLAVMIERARGVQRLLELARAEERQRVAALLHDDVTQLLFGVGTSARRARQAIGPEHHAADQELERIEALASSAASTVRSSLRALRPVPTDQRLALLVRAAIDGFIETTGTPVELAVLDAVPHLTPEVCRALVAVTREGLANVARHAPRSCALVSVLCDDRTVSVVVQDDGPGLPPGFDLRSVPGAGHTGLAGLGFLLDAVGGTLAVMNNDDGGVTLRATVGRSDPREV